MLRNLDLAITMGQAVGTSHSESLEKVKEGKKLQTKTGLSTWMNTSARGLNRAHLFLSGPFP